MVRLKCVFTGRVQHVGFRFTACHFARAQRLSGWVDNRVDGAVEMEVQGEAREVRLFVDRLMNRFDIRRAEKREIPVVHGETMFRARGY